MSKRKAEKLQRKKLPENLRTKPVTFGQLADDAIEHSKAENGERSTRELVLKYETLRPVFGSRAAEDISKQEIVRWLTSTLADSEWAPATKNRWQAALSLAFRVGMENDKIEKNPASRIGRTKEDNGACAGSPRKKSLRCVGRLHSEPRGTSRRSISAFIRE
ncbi:MAG TPA: hypothetical protein VKG65_01980 [Terriglobales bacterium]|nr:hypothetical protein [Terriglobales bacterium]